MRKIILSLGVSLLASSIAVSPANAQSASSPQLLHNPNAIEWEHRGNDKKMSVVEAATPSGQAISARIKKRKTNPWDTALWFRLDDGVEKGEKVSISFWARTAKAPKSQENAEIVVFVGRDEEPYDNVIAEDVLLESEWKLYTVEGVSDARFPKGKMKVEYQLAKHKQTVEFGPVFVNSLGK